MCVSLKLCVHGSVIKTDWMSVSLFPQIFAVCVFVWRLSDWCQKWQKTGFRAHDWCVCVSSHHAGVKRWKPLEMEMMNRSCQADEIYSICLHDSNVHLSDPDVSVCNSSSGTTVCTKDSPGYWQLIPVNPAKLFQCTWRHNAPLHVSEPKGSADISQQQSHTGGGNRKIYRILRPKSTSNEIFTAHIAYMHQRGLSAELWAHVDAASSPVECSEPV